MIDRRWLLFIVVVVVIVVIVVVLPRAVTRSSSMCQAHLSHVCTGSIVHS